MEYHPETVHSRGLEFRCPHCQSIVEVKERLLGTTIDCPNPDCGQPFLAKAPVAEPIVPGDDAPEHKADYQADELSEDDEEVLQSVHPSMWRHHPFRFAGLWLLLFAGISLSFMAYLLGDSAFGMNVEAQGILGLAFLAGCGVLLLVSWLGVRCTTLIITNKRTTYRRGIISRDLSEIRHQDVRNLQVDQNAFERMLAVGDIGISSSGQEDIEIKARHFPHPNKIADIIRQLE